jgi:hypothetical protein
MASLSPLRSTKRKLENLIQELQNTYDSNSQRITQEFTSLRERLRELVPVGVLESTEQQLADEKLSSLEAKELKSERQKYKSLDVTEKLLRYISRDPKIRPSVTTSTDSATSAPIAAGSGSSGSTSEARVRPRKTACSSSYRQSWQC